MSLFHLAIHVHDLDAARAFYGAQWRDLAQRLQDAGTVFVIAPSVRFEGQPGEQWTMFFRDPSGNPIEVKGFRSLAAVYDA